MKKITAFLTAMLLVALLCSQAFAADLDLVVDYSGVLTDSELSQLNADAQSISDQYGCEVIVFIVDTLDGYDVEDYSQSVFGDYNYGSGENNDGVMLFLAVTERKYDICAHGYGNTVFTDYGKELLADEFKPSLGDNNWYEGASIFIQACGNYLNQAAVGEPVDVYSDYGSDYYYPDVPFYYISGGAIVITLVISLIVALIVVLIMRGRMKTARKQTDAGEYIPDGGFNLTYSDDHYVTTTVSRVKRPDDNDNDSGGTTVNSSGYSHSSGSF